MNTNLRQSKGPTWSIRAFSLPATTSHIQAIDSSMHQQNLLLSFYRKVAKHSPRSIFRRIISHLRIFSHSRVPQKPPRPFSSNNKNPPPPPPSSSCRQMQLPFQSRILDPEILAGRWRWSCSSENRYRATRRRSFSQLEQPVRVHRGQAGGERGAEQRQPVEIKVNTWRRAWGGSFASRSTTGRKETRPDTHSDCRPSKI